MDTIIAEEVSVKKKKKLAVVVFLIAAVLALLVFSLRFVFHPSLRQKDITTAVVEMGPIENTINATGELLPEFEQVITSPIEASVQNVLSDAGKDVKAGESILLLDKTATQTEYEKLKFGVESKQNEVQKLRLELDKSFSDLKSNNDIKQLRINSLAAAVEDAKRLYKAGGGTKESIEQAELNLKVALLEKKQLENEIRSKQQTMQLQMKEAQLAAAIQENDLRELERKLQLANIVATRPGVVTWVNKNIGASIHPGETLVRIADLSSFKVNASIADTYLDQLRAGLPVIVRINDTAFRGTVASVHPAVSNGAVAFDVQLAEKSHRLFRPNMKVDVFLVTATRNNVMRVPNGPAFKGASTQDVFVLKDGVAQKRTVHVGLTNFDYVELKDNVKPGEVIITSDMSEYKNTKDVTVKNNLP